MPPARRALATSVLRGTTARVTTGLPAANGRPVVTPAPRVMTGLLVVSGCPAKNVRPVVSGPRVAMSGPRVTTGLLVVNGLRAVTTGLLVVSGRPVVTTGPRGTTVPPDRRALPVSGPPARVTSLGGSAPTTRPADRVETTGPVGMTGPVATSDPVNGAVTAMSVARARSSTRRQLASRPTPGSARRVVR